jgi:two-component system nitrogen regulation sensor histidine kinase NtrY
VKKLIHILPQPHIWLVAAVLLYLFSFLFEHSFSPTRSFNLEVKKLEAYIHAKQKEYNNLASDTALIKKLAEKRESQSEFDKFVSKTTGIFIFKKSIIGIELLSWSNQKTYPPNDIFRFADTTYFNFQENGYYICSKKTFERTERGDSLAVIGMIPVMYRYFAVLPEKFEYSQSASSKVVISGVPTVFPVKSISGNILFYISPRTQSPIRSDDLATVLKLVAILLLLLYIHFIAEQFAKQYGFWKGLIFLVVVLGLLRVLTYYTSFPVNLRQFEIFDPSIYASNLVHKSLGDLLINAILFCWIILFIWQKLDKTGFYILPGGIKGTIIGVVSSISVVVFTFIIAYTIRSLAADSSISFDVINIFSLTAFSVFGFIALSIIAVGYYYFIRIMVPLLSISFKENFYAVYLIAAVAGLTFLTFQIDNPLLSFYIIVLAWLIFYVWLSRLEKFGLNNQRQTMAAALFWIFIFSVSITAVIIHANREKEWQIRIIQADRIDRQTDPYNEKQLNISFTFIDNDFLAPNFYRFTNESSAMFLRDSLMHKNRYLENYDSRLYLFDANKNPLFNDEPEAFNTLDAILRVQAKATSVPHLFYYETAFDKYTFIFKQTVSDPAGKPIGYLFILSDPDQYNTGALGATLFKQADPADPDKAQVYSYGVYIDNILSTGPNNKYPFPTVLKPSDIPEERVEKRAVGNSTELWYKAKSDKIVVIAREKANTLEAITLFSYIFCIFLFLVAIFNLLLLLLRIGGNVKELRRILEWNIRTQIHGTIIFISILYFIIIAVATISFFILRYEQNNRERLSRTMEIMIKEMEKKLDNRRALDDQLAIYDSVSNQDVQSLVNDVAEIHNVDVNVYDTSGTLYITSQPLVYREGFLSKKMHPEAFYHLNRLRQVQRVQQERLATISYMSIYAPLRGKDDGIAYAYINIPYFLSQSELKQEISNFLVTIINLNAFIFLIAGVIALFITNRVTRSFLLISEKMKEVNLGKTNEEIEWKRNDEIGGLVREYNKMVTKLEGSAEALARSEREGAWREMARQVAHEIKNPLTPMKLSIQFLQKAIDNNSPNVKELTGNVAKTLVEQIDHLSKIAFDFSQFANIGNTNIETFDINEVIRSLDNLYKNSLEGDLILNTIPGKVMIRADKTQMNRLFTNLIQNAIEACDEKKNCSVELNELQVDGVVQISIKDNGAGIPVEMQSKIFVPNFTTKSSGTGLGLAMCKGIAEQAGGRIWFETEKGEGSTFYVELPVIN